MQINQYKFRIELEFHPPPDCHDTWKGIELHEETMLASSPEVAARAIKSWVLKRIGTQRHRLFWMRISDPELVQQGDRNGKKQRR